MDRPGPHSLDSRQSRPRMNSCGLVLRRDGSSQGGGNYCFIRVGTIGQFILVCIQVAHLRNNP
jgi:hypothetical protein